MKAQQVPQVAVVTAKDSIQLQDRMNEEMKKHPDVVNIIVPEGDNRRAIIQYTITEIVPEDEDERYYLETGKRYYCNDCPNCIWDSDRRAVTHWCDLHQDRVQLKTTACDEFYAMLREGNIRPVTAEERNARYAQMDQQQKDRREEERNHATKMYKIKKREAKYAEQLLKATTQLREEEQLLNDNYRPFYTYEMLDVHHPLCCQSFHSNEVNLIVNGRREELSEKELITIAKELNATLVRCEEMEQIDTETLAWHKCTELWTSTDENV